MRERSGANADRRSGSAWYPRSEEDLAAGRDAIRALYNDPLFVTTFTNGIVIDGTYIPSVDTPIVNDVTPPAIPSGLTLTTGLRTIFVSWDDVADLDTTNGQGTYEVQIATDAAFTTDLRTLRKSGTFTQFSDLQPDTLYYARVRAIDRFGNASSYSPSSNGTTTQAGTSDLSVGSVTTALLDADAVTAEKLATIELEVGKYIQSTSYTAGSAGWRINADGSAEFQDVTVRGVFKTANSGARMEIKQTGGVGEIQSYSGLGGESSPARITITSGVLTIHGADFGSGFLSTFKMQNDPGSSLAYVESYANASGGGEGRNWMRVNGTSGVCELRLKSDGSSAEAMVYMGSAARLTIQSGATYMADATRNRIYFDSSRTEIQSPNGSWTWAAANSDVYGWDGSRRRIYFNGSESVLMAPSGTSHCQVTDSVLRGVVSNVIRVEASSTQTITWSPNGVSHAVTVENAQVAVWDGTRYRIVCNSTGSSLVGPDGTGSIIMGASGAITLPGIQTSAAATSAAHINAGAGNHLYRFTSREAYKRDITSWTSEMLIRGVRPVTFFPLDDDPVWKEMPEAAKVRQLGFIVEELAAVSPMLVTWDGDDGEPMSPNITALLALLVSEVQRLDRRLDVLEAAARTTTPTGVRP